MPVEGLSRLPTTQEISSPPVPPGSVEPIETPDALATPDAPDVIAGHDALAAPDVPDAIAGQDALATPDVPDAIAGHDALATPDVPDVPDAITGQDALATPDALAAQDPMEAPRPRAAPTEAFCANCLTPLSGPFCAQCGQHSTDYHQSVWRLTAEFFDNAFCWDNKFLRTLSPLLLRPGFLTSEYIVGRRARYVHPLRLFLFTSAVCLTLLQFTRHKDVHVNVIPAAKEGSAQKSSSANAAADATDDDDADPKAAADGAVAATPALAGKAGPASTAGPDQATFQAPFQETSAVPSISPATPGAGAATGTTSSATAATTAAKPAEDHQPDSWLRGVIQSVANDEHESALHKAVKTERPDAQEIGKTVAAKVKKAGAIPPPRDVANEVMKRLSWVALGMLPLFACLLQTVYGRSGQFFFTHAVFSLHYHAFLLIFYVAYTAVRDVLEIFHFMPFDIVLWLVLLAPPWYLYRGLRQVYGEGGGRTLAKVFVVGAVHLILLIIGLSAVGTFVYMRGLPG